ncbi:hypothetical protein D3C87_841530 [compost metagenome]
MRQFPRGRILSWPERLSFLTLRETKTIWPVANQQKKSQQQVQIIVLISCFMARRCGPVKSNRGGRIAAPSGKYSLRLAVVHEFSLAHEEEFACFGQIGRGERKNGRGHL